MTRQELNELIRRNSALAERNPDLAGLPAAKPKHPARGTLGKTAQREDQGSERYEIVFTVFSRRPCDWDNYHIKELQDVACKAGILHDDNWAALQGRVVTKKAESKEQERTEVTICRIS